MGFRTIASRVTEYTRTKGLPNHDGTAGPLSVEVNGQVHTNGTGKTSDLNNVWGRLVARRSRTVTDRASDRLRNFTRLLGVGDNRIDHSAIVKFKSFPPEVRKDVRHAFYQQVLQPTFPDSVAEPSPEVLQHVASFFSQDPDALTSMIDHLSADRLYQALIASAQGLSIQSEIENLVLRTRHGQDTWLRKFADGFVAVHMIQNEQIVTNGVGEPVFDISTDYLMFFYSLMGGVLAAENLGDGFDRLQEYFEQNLRTVDRLFVAATHQNPPVFNEVSLRAMFSVPRRWLAQILVPKEKAHKESLPFTPTGIDLRAPVTNVSLHRMPEPREWKDAAVVLEPDLRVVARNGVDVEQLEQKEKDRLASINDAEGYMSRVLLNGFVDLWIRSKAKAGIKSDYSHAKLAAVLVALVYECVKAGRSITNAGDIEEANQALMKAGRSILCVADAHYYKSEDSLAREVEVIVKAALEGRGITKGMSHIGIGDIPKTAAEDGSSRIVAKRLMGTAWPLREIFKPMRMTLVDRPEDTVASVSTFYDQVISSIVPLYQRLQGLEARYDQEKEVDYSSGTRSKKGGQAPLRDGSAKLIGRLFVPGFSRSGIPLRMVSSSLGVDQAGPSTFGDVLRGAHIDGAIIPDRTSYFDPIELYENYIEENLDGRHPETGEEWERLQTVMESRIKALEYQMLIRLMIEAVADLRFAEKEDNGLEDGKKALAISMYQEYISRYADAFALLENGERVSQSEVPASKRYTLAGVKGDVSLELVNWCNKYKVGYAFVVQLYHFVLTSREDYQRWNGLGTPPAVAAPAKPDRTDINPVLAKVKSDHKKPAETLKDDIRQIKKVGERVEVAVLDRVHKQATPVRDSLKKPKESNEARKVLNQFLDQFYEPLSYHFAGTVSKGKVTPKLAERDEWLQANGFGDAEGQRYFLELASWINRSGEIVGVFKRHKASFEEKRAQLLNLVLPETIYTPEEQRRFGALYMMAAARWLGTTGPALALQMKESGILDLDRRDSVAVRSAKLFGRRFAGVPTIKKLKPALTEDEVKNVVSEDRKLDPVSREQTIAYLEELASREPYTELPKEAEQRVRQAYGYDAELYAKAIQLTIDYLNFEIEMAGRMLDVYKNDTPTDNTQKMRAQAAWQADFEASTWDGNPIERHVYAMLMHSRDIAKILGQDEEDLPEFQRLVAAERELDVLVRRGSTDDIGLDQYDLELAKARRRVSEAYRDYSLAVGMGPSDETFLHLPWAGLAIPHSHLQYIFQRESLREANGREEILKAHRELSEVNGLGGIFAESSRSGRSSEKLRREKDANEKFQRLMRTFLDREGNSRAVQAELLRLKAAREALVKNPATFLWEVFGRANPDEHSLSTAEKAYWDAMIRYKETNDLADMGAVEKAASKLLEAPEGFRLIDAAHDYIHESLPQMSLAGSFGSYQRYWQERRLWAQAERKRKEEIRPDKIDFSIWQLEQTNRFLNDHADLNFAVAEAMMSQARDLASHNPKLAEQIRHFERIYENAMTQKDHDIRHFINQQSYQTEHLQNVRQGQVDEERENTGHFVRYNRASEFVGRLESEAYNAAARAWSLATGKTPPQMANYLRQAMAEKLRPEFDPRVHANDAENFFEFMGTRCVPPLVGAIWMIHKGYPKSVLDQYKLRWGQGLSEEFHDVRVDDQRRSLTLPGFTEVSDATHDTWFWDYGTQVYLSPNGESYILVAKPGLDKILPYPMNFGARVLAILLPDTPYQPSLDGEMTSASGNGVYQVAPWGDVALSGSQNIVLWGGLTLTTINLSDLNSLNDPSRLFTASEATGFDLRGIGRSSAVVLRRVAVDGTSLGVVPTITKSSLVHNSGVKPDGYLRINPKSGVVSIVEDDHLTWGIGEELVDEDQIRSVALTRQLTESDIHWDKTKMGVEAMARQAMSMPQVQAGSQTTNGYGFQRPSVRRLVRRVGSGVVRRLGDFATGRP